MVVVSFIESLKQELGSSIVFTPESSEYAALVHRWADSATPQADAIVCPSSAAEVSQAVVLATKHDVTLAICGSSHWFKMSKSYGLIIDLRRMNAVDVSSADQTITCGGGASWAAVDDAAAAHGLATVGATLGEIGVGGSTLGGGYGWLTGQLGAAVDRLVAAEVVLADGRVTFCSAIQEPDLFWALRGAGHSFGAVTKFVFAAIVKTEPVYGGLVTFPGSAEAVQHVVDTANAIYAAGDSRTAMQIGFATINSQRFVFAACFHDGPVGAAVFAPLLAGTVSSLSNTLRTMAYQEMNTVLTPVAASGGRRTAKGATFPTPLPAAAFQHVLDASTAAGDAGAALFEFYQTAALTGTPFAATALASRGSHQNALFVPQWAHKVDDARMQRLAREMAGVVAETHGLRLAPAPEYINFDGQGTSAETLFGAHYARLRALKARYDPCDVFTKPHGLGTGLAALASQVSGEEKGVVANETVRTKEVAASA